MSFSRSSSSFYFLIIFTLILQTVSGLDPLFQICSSNTQNFTTNTPYYEANLSKLMVYLYRSAPLTEFGVGLIGQTPNQAYGLALCRGDVSNPLCKSCVVEASDEILKSCPNSKTAIIWYDQCLLKYSDEQFFGQIDNKNKFAILNTQNVSDPYTFNQKTKMLLGRLANETIVTRKFYAAGEMELSGQDQSEKLYGMAQCGKDLSTSDCKCLDGVIGELPSCCDGKQRGRVVTGSCNIRYEIALLLMFETCNPIDARMPRKG